MTDKEKEYWGDTPQHTIDFANRCCLENRARIRRQALEQKEWNVKYGHLLRSSLPLRADSSI